MTVSLQWENVSTSSNMNLKTWELKMKKWSLGILRQSCTQENQLVSNTVCCLSLGVLIWDGVHGEKTLDFPTVKRNFSDERPTIFNQLSFLTAPQWYDKSLWMHSATRRNLNRYWENLLCNEDNQRLDQGFREIVVTLSWETFRSSLDKALSSLI